MTLRCSTCKQSKDCSEFHHATKTKRGYQRVCKDCKAVYIRRPEVREKFRSYNRKRSYGVTEEQFDEMVAVQNGVCRICERARPLCVDHDHMTGRVRGLLCQPCNLALGCLEDNNDRLKRAIAYLDGVL